MSYHRNLGYPVRLYSTFSSRREVTLCAGAKEAYPYLLQCLLDLSALWASRGPRSPRRPRPRSRPRGSDGGSRRTWSPKSIKLISGPAQHRQKRSNKNEHYQAARHRACAAPSPRAMALMEAGSERRGKFMSKLLHTARRPARRR